MTKKETALVLFSGGRDSSSTVIEMVRAGYQARLFTVQAGSPELVGPLGDSAPAIRQKELLKAFPEQIDPERVIASIAYLIKRLGIDKTNSTHVVYPLVFVLSAYASAILYCLEHGIKHIAFGYSGYQAKEDRYIEQRDDFFQLAKSFLGEYGITLHAPVITKTEQEVMDILESCGVSSNSLETKSLFCAVPFEVSKANDFWNESIPFVKEYIERMRVK